MLPNLLRQLLPSTSSTQIHAARSVWILRHARRPYRNVSAYNPDGQQLHPHEHKSLMLYELVENTEEKKHKGVNEIDMLLTKRIEGLGSRGDVVKMKRRNARIHILAGHAVYPSPFNLALYEADSKTAKKDTSAHLNVSTVLLARSLQNRVLVVHMNYDTDWTLTRDHIRLAMRKAGRMIIDVNSIIMPVDTIKGPNMDIDGSLHKGYLLLDRQVIVPLIIRIRHVSSDPTKEIIANTANDETATPEELKKYKLAPQKFYAHSNATLTPDAHLIRAIMAKHDQETAKS